MTCRHGPGDPDCTSRPKRAPKVVKTPDSKNYTIDDVQRVGSHLVMKVNYPNCSACAYEGTKVMVFLDVSEADVLRWKEIDPHFREVKPSRTMAPSPAARFPSTGEGWCDAIAYAKTKG